MGQIVSMSVERTTSQHVRYILRMSCKTDTEYVLTRSLYARKTYTAPRSPIFVKIADYDITFLSLYMTAVRSEQLMARYFDRPWQFCFFQSR